MFEIFNNIEEFKKMCCIIILSLYSLDIWYVLKFMIVYIS